MSEDPRKSERRKLRDTAVVAAVAGAVWILLHWWVKAFDGRSLLLFAVIEVVLAAETLNAQPLTPQTRKSAAKGLLLHSALAQAIIACAFAASLWIVDPDGHIPRRSIAIFAAINLAIFVLALIAIKIFIRIFSLPKR